MKTLAQEYLLLIEETLAFLKKDPFLFFSENASEITLPPSPKISETPKPSRENKKEEQTSLPTPPKITPPQKTSSAKMHNWELYPMGGPIELENSSLKSKLARHLKLIEPVIAYNLILPEEVPSHRLFLENVARAITCHYQPARVQLYHEALFNLSCKSLFFFPAPLVQKKFPKAETYKLIEKEGFSLMPIENLDQYIQDATAKRALWTAIQSLFQS